MKRIPATLVISEQPIEARIEHQLAAGHPADDRAHLKSCEECRTVIYNAQSARQAAASNYGSMSYLRYLDSHAERMRDYFLRHGDTDQAERMMTRSLGEALAGNNGD